MHLTLTTASVKQDLHKHLQDMVHQGWSDKENNDRHAQIFDAKLLVGFVELQCKKVDYIC